MGRTIVHVPGSSIVIFALKYREVNGTENAVLLPFEELDAETNAAGAGPGDRNPKWALLEPCWRSA